MMSEVLLFSQDPITFAIAQSAVAFPEAAVRALSDSLNEILFE
jgi:hypothetical protein